MSEEFILNTRAEDVINEAIVACRGLADNFSSLPVVEYVCSAIILNSIPLTRHIEYLSVHIELLLNLNNI